MPSARCRATPSLVFLSDETTASMRAQDRLLEKDAIRACFAATIYDGGEKNRFHTARVR